MNKCKSHSVSAFRSLCVSVRRRAIRTKEKKCGQRLRDDEPERDHV